VVIGEDLGTVPHGFREQVSARGVLGMRVLWFERDGTGAFTPPSRWSREAVAMTTTHDLPTVAGWWRGHDIALREDLGLFGEPDRAAQERAARADDRQALWRAFLESGAATGDPPGPEADPGPVVDAALAHVGGAACALALLPLEDALALDEQPNVPGTVDQHPNWRRRLPGEAGTLLDDPATARRVEAFAHARHKAGEA
jgi:4-alpha-glucanotransferase